MKNMPFYINSILWKKIPYQFRQELLANYAKLCTMLNGANSTHIINAAPTIAMVFFMHVYEISMSLIFSF